MLKKLLSFVMIFALVLSVPAGVIPDGGNVICAAAVKVWNGKTDTKWYTGDLDYYEISTAEQLAGLAELVNNGTDFKGILICLTKDVALNKTTNFKNWDKKNPAHQWTMIGSKDHPFRGTFNGQGHTISGLYIKDTEKYSSLFSTWYTNAGLFGYVRGAKIVNVKIKNVYLNVLGVMGTISAFSQNSDFYGIEINNVKLLSGTAGGIVGKATYDYSEAASNLLIFVGMEAIAASGGMIINPLLFGDLLKFPNDFEGNVFFSCKVKNLKCLDTKTTGGIVALGGSSDSGIGCANCLVMNYTVKSDRTKGIMMGVQPNEKNAVIQNCFSTDSSIDKKSADREFVDKKSVKTLKKKTLYKSGASKLGKAFKKVKGKEPQLKIYTMTKLAADESKYRILEDGYYTISFKNGYITVDGDADVVISDTPQRWYFKYREGGFYTITTEDGYALTGTSSNDDIFAQKVEYDEHRFTQRWVVEQRKEDLYYIWLKDTEKVVSQFTGGWLLIPIPGTGISLEEDWVADVDSGHNVVWNITPAQ